MNKTYQEISPVEQDQLQQGVVQLQLRRRKMRIYMILSSLIAGISLITLIFNQQLIYAFFEITPTVKQLHIPFSADVLQQQVGNSPDYFGRLLAWVMWFGLKIIAAVIGAAILVHYARKLNFFKKRLKTFAKRVLAWVIGVILIWSSLAWLQVEMMEGGHQNEEYADLVEYKDHIEQSDIFQYVSKSSFEPVVQHYLLGQTALLHQPIDKDAAIKYTAQLIQAEQDQANDFIRHGFKPEQLWAMQRQLYGQAVTPLAKTVDARVIQIDQVVAYTRYALLFSLAIFFTLFVIFYGLTKQFNQRLLRIDQRLH